MHGNKNQMKIIIADDHAMFRDGIREILLKTSFISEVDETSSGEELLGKILDKQYDMILLDIGLPGKRGLEVLKRNSDNPPWDAGNYAQYAF